MSVGTSFAALLFVAAVVFADATLEYASDSRPEDAHVIMVKDGDVIMGDRRAELLFNEQRRELVIIDHLARVYTVVDEPSAERLGRQRSAAKREIADALEQLKAQLDSMPEEQRAVVEKLLEQEDLYAAFSNQLPQVLTFERRGRQSVAGWDCARVVAAANGEPLREFCVVPPRVLGIDDRDFAGLSNAMRVVRDMMHAMGANAVRPMSMDLGQMQGIPVSIENLGQAEVITLRSHSTGELAASKFAIPQDYRNHPLGP